MPSIPLGPRGPQDSRVPTAWQPGHVAAVAAPAASRRRVDFGRAAKASALALFLMASAAVLPAGGGLAGTAYAQTTAAQAKSELTRQLDAIVTEDSRRWFSNRYIKGSMRNLEIRSVANNGQDFVMVGHYTYNGSLLQGADGWVAAKVAGGKVQCLEFHDAPGKCRPLNQPVWLNIFRGGSGNGGGMSHGEFDELMRHNNRMRGNCDGGMC